MALGSRLISDPNEVLLALDEIGSELSDFSESFDTEEEDFMPGNDTQVEESESEVTPFCFIKFAFSKFFVTSIDISSNKLTPRYTQ